MHDIGKFSANQNTINKVIVRQSCHLVISEGAILMTILLTAASEGEHKALELRYHEKVREM